MIDIQWKRKGVFALADMTPSATSEHIGKVVAVSIQQAIGDYAMGRISPKLADRTSPDAFSVYGFSARDPKYQRKQIKVLGLLRPYYSPRGIDFAKLALALTKHGGAAGKAMKLVRAASQIVFQQAHLADLIRIPGTGFNARVVQTRRDVTVTLTLPGARVLNRGGSRNEMYRKQLLDLSRGGGRDGKAILARAQEYYDALLIAEINEHGTAPLRTSAA